MTKVPVYDPALTPEDAAAVTAAVASGLISGTAPPVQRFEAACAAYCGMRHAVAVSSGTAALELAVVALALGPGDEVLCPAFTIISCARAIVASGATPVLVDVDPSSWCIDVGLAEGRAGPRTRAVLGVHAFGHPYDHAGMTSLARRKGLLIIEDAAQAHGARIGGESRPCGGLGDASIFSFYANKSVTTGEGGMVLTDSDAVAGRVRDLSNLSFGQKHRFLHEELGHNYRLSSIQAALGLAQLSRLSDTIERKRHIARRYRDRLSRLEEVELQGVSGDVEPVPWMNALVLSDEVPADAGMLGAALARRGIETRPLFIGLHEQPALISRGLFAGERYPVTERLARRGLYLPSGLSLDEGAIDHVVTELCSALSELRNPSAAVPSTTPVAGPPTTNEAAPASAGVFGTLFAEGYDALYADKDYAGEAALVERCFARFSSRPVRRVLDLGCGTGRHVRELAARGYEVVGVDRSAAMLDGARRRMPSTRFVEADMTSVDLGECFDAVVVLFAALSYQTTPDTILGALRAARRHLTPGGLLVADVWLGAAPATAGNTVTRRTAGVSGVDWTRTGFLRRKPAEQRVDVAYELERRTAEGEMVAREVHCMHYFSPFELTFALMLSGFHLLHTSKEADLDKAPTERDLTGLFIAEAC